MQGSRCSQLDTSLVIPDFELQLLRSPDLLQGLHTSIKLESEY